MYCPDCGTENVRGQKFCTRCGSNLLAIDRARDIITEFSAAPPASQISSSTILKIVALISTFGFLIVTGGTIFLMAIDGGRTPVPLFFGFAGLASMVLICRHLLRLIGAPAQAAPQRTVQPQAQILSAAPARGATNRRLSEGDVSYHSVVEERTRQFEQER